MFPGPRERGTAEPRGLCEEKASKEVRARLEMDSGSAAARSPGGTKPGFLAVALLEDQNSRTRLATRVCTFLNGWTRPHDLDHA